VAGNNRGVGEAELELVRRAMDQFNWEFAEGRSGVSDATRALFVEEPLIVPFRAALEGTQYSGPTALDEYAAGTRVSWAWLRIDAEDLRPLDDEHVLVTGRLRGAGREFGAETQASLALLFEIEGGRVAAARTFTSEREALAAART
jgi:hypothetical protein